MHMLNNKIESITLIVKPTTKCNLNCKYCYDRMSRCDDILTLEDIDNISKVAARDANDITWIWHGGEPLLMGYEWLDKAFNILNKNGIKKSSIQTNATLLSDDIINLLIENNCSVGISYDGFNNDITRGSGESVKNNILKYSKMAQKEPGCIKVVDPTNLPFWSMDYEYFKETGIKHVHYNKVFYAEGVSLIEGDNINIFKEQFSKLFHKWVNDKDPVYIRNFSEIISYILGIGGIMCDYHGNCLGRYFSISPKGIIFPCDRHMEQQWSYGSIKDDFSFLDIVNSEKIKDHLNIYNKRLENCKNKKCHLIKFCNGGCHSSAIADNDGTSGVENECTLKKIEFNHIFNFLMTADINNIKNPELSKILSQAGFRNLNLIKGMNSYV